MPSGLGQSLIGEAGKEAKTVTRVTPVIHVTHVTHVTHVARATFMQKKAKTDLYAAKAKRKKKLSSNSG